MNRSVGIWIDHRKAVIVFAEGDRVTTKTVESEVGPHARYSDRSNYPMPDAPEVGRGEKNFEGRYRERLHRYYDEVIRAIGQPEALLIFGPAEAKLELRKRLDGIKAFSKAAIEVEATGKFTDAQLLAHVRDYFGPAHGNGASEGGESYPSSTT